MIQARVAFAAALILSVPVRCSAAGWVLAPIVGTTFRSTTGFVDLDDAAGHRHAMYGASVMHFPEGFVGVAGEIAIVPSFFTGHDLVESSRVTTANVSAVIAMPRRLLARIRPFAIVGVGLVRSSSQDVRTIFPIDSTLPAFNAGIGVLVPLTRHVAVRADSSFIRTTTANSASAIGAGFLEVWRIAGGVAWVP